MPHKSKTKFTFILNDNEVSLSVTVKFGAISEMPGEPKVSDFNVQVVVEQNVFWLQVPVHNVARVYEVDAFEDLTHDEASLLF